MTNEATPIKITDEIKEAVNGALANGTPVVVAYVNEDGQPSLSFRGSTQVYSDDQLAIWVRNPDGGLLRSLSKNPRITILYRNPATRQMLNFQGRAHVEDAADVREKVYSSAPESEQRADAEKKGRPLIIDLDRVAGAGPSGRIMMQRS
jgi:hypothetical protein